MLDDVMATIETINMTTKNLVSDDIAIVVLFGY
jgi:hypothetical protein